MLASIVRFVALLFLRELPPLRLLRRSFLPGFSLVVKKPDEASGELLVSLSGYR